MKLTILAILTIASSSLSHAAALPKCGWGAGVDGQQRSLCYDWDLSIKRCEEINCSHATNPSLLIEDANNERAKVEFHLSLTPATDPNCQGLGQTGSATSYPTVGSRMRMTNESPVPLLIEADLLLAENYGDPGFHGRWVQPFNHSHAEFAPKEIIPASVVGTVLVLKPKQSIDVIIPQPLANPDKNETEVQLRCQSVDAFMKRPKFSYGSGVDFEFGFLR